MCIHTHTHTISMSITVQITNSVLAKIIKAMAITHKKITATKSKSHLFQVLCC